MNEIEEEEKRLNKLRKLVDGTCILLKSYPMTDKKAQQFIEEVKIKVLELFPDKEDQFELIYRPRFQRILDERKTKDG